jgi:TRAP-type C4-dicarboxylate transport system permease small subunit
MANLISRLNKLLAEFCGLMLVLMVLFLVVELVSRLIKMPVQGGSILAVFVMVIAVYFGLAACEEKDKHIKVNALVKLLPSKIQIGIDIFNYLLLLTLFAIVSYAVGKNMIYSYQNAEAVPSTILIPVWPVKIMMFCGLVCFWLQLAGKTYAKLKNLITGDRTNGLHAEDR